MSLERAQPDMATKKATLPVIEALSDRVVLGGEHPTGDGKGTHSMLQPQVLLSELTHAQPPQIGDSIEVMDDGTYVHVPKVPAP